VSLQEFQNAFADALAGIAPEPSVARLVQQPAFAVYRNTVLKGCVDALEANYPAVARLTGPEWLRAAAAVFARSHMPEVPMLASYGEGFAGFLAGFEPAAELPYLPGVAALDRLWTEAHLARDEAPLPAARVAAIGAEGLARAVLRPHASARWLWCADMPVATLWRRNRDGEACETPIEWRGEGLLLVRPRDSVQSVELDATGCGFLDACKRGGTVSDAVAAALDVDARADLSLLMSQLLRAGAFGGLQFQPEEMR
jgi:hypothetical protein